MDLTMASNSAKKPTTNLDQSHTLHDYATAGNARSTDQTHAHFRNVSEPSNIITMQDSSPINNLRKKEQLLENQMFKTDSERLAT